MSEYTKEELEEYALELQNKLQKYEDGGGRQGGSRSPQLSSQQNAIVEWQLNLDKELELIYHQIRGHVIKRELDDKGRETGREYWAEPDDPEQKLLNEKGAQEVEKIIRNYLNKNLLLSDFDIKIINHRVSQFAHRLRRLIYLNYEEFGLTTYYKQKHFEMLVMNIVDMVEAAYNRAKDGGERQSLTTIRQIIQSENIDNRPSTASYSSGSGGGQRRGIFGRIFGR